MRSLSTLVTVAITSLFMSGCGSTPVADDVGQREANQIVSVLEERGIPAQVSKARGSKGKYSVAVADARYSEAAGILTQVGLPADKKASFQEMIATNGIIPPSREVEALRVDRAAAAEIEDILRARPEVAGVSVLLRARAFDSKGVPSATVVIQRRAGVEIDLDTVRQIAARAVPGMNVQDVFVSVVDSLITEKGKSATASHAEPEMVSFLGISRVPASEYHNHVFLFIALSVFVGALAGLSGYLIGQFNFINRGGSADIPKGSLARAGSREPSSEGDIVEYDRTDSDA
jgi:type III secretory pathway lipoprotein EscJ